MTDQELQRRLLDFEDGWTERRPEGRCAGDELRHVLVAFANSVPEGTSGILFIGVADNGEPLGLGNVESLQQTVQEDCARCYPPVDATSRALKFKDKDVLAVIVGHSKKRPHFPTRTKVRRSSRNVWAADADIDALISSRNTKAGLIIEEMVNVRIVTVIVTVGSRLDGVNPVARAKDWECRVEDCNAQFAYVRNIASGYGHSLTLEYVTLSRDDRNGRLRLIFDNSRR